jgi:signal transduction histidine kinase
MLAAIVPAGVLLERRLQHSIEVQVRRELSAAPGVVAESRAQSADGLMMHAKEIAAAPGLAVALMRGDHDHAHQLVEAARGGYGQESVLIAANGEQISGPTPPDTLVALTRAGGMPVELVSSGSEMRTIALAPVQLGGSLVGVAGVSVMLGETEARVLASLTHANVLVLDRTGRIMATTLDSADVASVAAHVREWDGDTAIVALTGSDGRLLVRVTRLGNFAFAAFTRDLARDFAILGALRVAGALALLCALVALAIGAVFASRLTRPVRSLAAAAEQLTAGDFHAPLERSRISEVRRMADAFDVMRRSLAARLAELQSMNARLAERQARLSALQAELIQRDRLAAAGRLVAQLAHEIRNPVANVRNCLELIRRRLDDDPETREFADLAIDELLRMHELAEQMLDLHRPRPEGARVADVATVTGEVATLARLGAPAGLDIVVDAAADLRAAIAPDALKQVLLNLVQNAREAMHERGRISLEAREQDGSVTIEVRDSGPGIPSDVMPRLFDPFFTTKRGVHGVGLGLFVAEGVVRGVGGRIAALSTSDGACFVITLPLAATAPPPSPRSSAGVA